jgi:antitoxin PrlF
MSQSIVTTRGRVTIPADIRKGLGLKAQDRVMFTKMSDGTVLIRVKTRSAMGLKGVLCESAYAQRA